MSLLAIWIAFAYAIKLRILHLNDYNELGQSLRHIFDMNQDQIEYFENQHNDYTIIEQAVNSLKPSIVIISKNSLRTFQYSHIICEKLSIPQINLTNFIWDRKYLYNASSLISDKVQAVLSLLEYFNWNEFNFIQGIDQLSTALYNELHDKIIEKVVLPQIASQTSIESTLARIIKPSGKRLLVISTSKENSMIISNALKALKIYSEGFGVLFLGDAAFGMKNQGDVGIIEEQLSSPEDSDLAVRVISSLKQKLDWNTKFQDIFDNKTINQKMQEIFKRNNWPANFSIINFQKYVGSIEQNSISIQTPILFPGNVLQIPKNELISLLISGNTSTFNPGADPNYQMNSYQTGITYALDYVNSDKTILTNFLLDYHIMACGSTIYIEEYMDQCVRNNKDKLGIAVISSPAIDTTIGLIKSLDKLGVNKLIISANNSSILSSKEDWPYIIKVQAPVIENIPSLFLILQILDWKKINVAYYESTSTDYYQRLIEFESLYNVQIVNQSDKRSLGYDTISKEIDDVIQELKDSGARMTILLAKADPLLFEALHQAGIEPQDFFMFYSDATIQSAHFFWQDRDYFSVMSESFQLKSPVYQGNIGAQVYWKTMQSTSPIDQVCFAFDTLFLLSNAINFCLLRGLDYDDTDTLNNAIRLIKIFGCQGNLHVSSQSNDTALQLYELYQLQFNQDDKLLRPQLLYQISPYTVTFIKPINPPLYDQKEEKPSTLKIFDYDCPFQYEEVQDFTNGQILAGCIGIGMLLITTSITFYIWRLWSKKPIPMFLSEREIYLPDILVFVTIVIDVFQFLSLGPDLSVFNELLEDLASATSINLANFITFEKGTFWLVLHIVFCCIGFWLYCCVIAIFQLDQKLHKLYIMRVSGELAEIIIPILGHIGFLPIMSTLFNIFLCDKSIGDEFTDSFMNKDCYEFCWEKNHMMYAILGLCCIFVYQPIAIYTRPIWQEQQPGLSLFASYKFLMIKSVIQMILIVLNKTMNGISETTYNYIFIMIIFSYYCFICRYKPFNYARANLWQYISIMIILIVCVVSLISYNTDLQDWILLTILLLIILALILGGLIYQYFLLPNFLFLSKNKDIGDLFRFQFGFKSQSVANHIRHQLTYPETRQSDYLEISSYEMKEDFRDL